MSCGAAEMAVRWWLSKIAPDLVALSESGAALPTVCIVTGAGKTRPGHQTRDVRDTIEQLLVDLRVPTITPLHDWRENAKLVKRSALVNREKFERLVRKQHEGALYMDAEALVLTARHDPGTTGSWWVTEVGVRDGDDHERSRGDEIAT